MEPVLLALDFETANQDPDSACQIGLVRLEGWRVVGEAARLVRPPTDLFLFSHIHGITWERVSGEPSWDRVWPELAPYFEGVDFLAAHNARFDQGVLEASCARYGLAAPSLPAVDTVQVARRVWNIFPTKLNLVCQRLGIPLDHHEALSDARACAEIVLRAHAEGWTPAKG